MKRLILSLTLVVIAAVIGLGWLVGQLYFQFENKGDHNELIAYQIFGKSLAGTLDNMIDPELFLQQWQHYSTLSISLQDRLDFPIPAELSEDFDKGEGLVLESNKKISLHFSLTNSGKVMSITLPESSTAYQTSVLNVVLTVSFYVGIVLIILLWLWPLIKRLIILQRTTRLFGLGDTNVRIKLSQTSYISDIELEFNRMADRIQSLIEDNKLLGRAVSHDLKTPLTRLRFGIDAIEETRDPAQRDKYVQRINEDLNKMDSLVDTLLQYARLDEANIRLKSKLIPLEKFIPQLFDEIQSTSIKINYNLIACTIKSDERYLAMLLNNIIGNALKHAKSNISVNVFVSEEMTSIQIEDDGDGIPLSDRENVTKPFWRGGNREGQPGHGMGLAIVSRIAQWLNLSLIISDSVNLGGASITLQYFPD